METQKKIQMAVFALFLLGCSAMVGSNGASGSGGGVGESHSTSTGTNDGVPAGDNVSSVADAHGSTSPGAPNDVPAALDNSSSFADAHNSTHLEQIANHPLDNGSATLQKSVESMHFSILKIEICRFPEGMVHLNLIGQLTLNDVDDADFDGSVVRLFDSEQQKAIDTVTHIQTFNSPTKTTLHGVFQFDIVTEADLPIQLYVMKKDFVSKLLDSPFDVGDVSTWSQFARTNAGPVFGLMLEMKVKTAPYCSLEKIPQVPFNILK